MLPYRPDVASESRHRWLASAQDTRYAVIAVHGPEVALFRQYMESHPAFNRSDAGPDWIEAAVVWNARADGTEIFYKVNQPSIDWIIC